MDIIQVKDKTFKPFISNETLQENIARVAKQMDEELAGKDPLFIGVLNGSFMFIGDLMRRLQYHVRLHSLSWLHMKEHLLPEQ